MKLRFILGITALLLLAACGSQQFVCPDGTTVEDTSQCPPEAPAEEPGTDMDVETPPAPEEKPDPEPVMDIDLEVEELMEKADEKVNSFSFVYVGPPENLPRDKYYVMGDKIGVELLKETDFKISQPFTHVYIDTARDTAVAYCTARDKVRCPDGVVSHGTVPAEEYYVKTPYQWMKDLQSAEYMGSGPQWEKRATEQVRFTTKDGVSGEMLIVDFFALPARIDLDNGDHIEFRDMAVNSVRPEDVNPPSI